MTATIRILTLAIVAFPLFLSAVAEEPTVEEVKSIAGEAYVYGLPLVMAYTASYEFWLDKSSSQYKSPMGELVHSRRVFTYEDTAVMRLYWPQTESPSILPPGAGDWVPPAVQIVK